MGVIVQAVPSLKDRITGDETLANTAKVWARETFEKMSKIHLLVEGLTLGVGGSAPQLQT